MADNDRRLEVTVTFQVLESMEDGQKLPFFDYTNTWSDMPYDMVVGLQPAKCREHALAQLLFLLPR